MQAKRIPLLFASLKKLACGCAGTFVGVHRLAELCTGFRQENAHSRFEDFYFLERSSILWAKAQ
jgi:dihydroorotase